MTLWSHGLAKSCEKLKPLYLHNHNAYGHKAWQDVDFPWASSSHKVTWPYTLVNLWDHVIEWNNYIFTTTMYVAVKHGVVGIYHQELPSVKPRGPLITWSCKLTWNIRSVTSLLPQDLWPPNLQGGDLSWEASTYNFTQPFQYVVIIITSSKGSVDNYIHYIFTTTMTLAIKLGRVVTYDEELPSLKLKDPLMTWICKVTWQIK